MYEKRKEEIISPKDKKPTKRIARFLKPFAKDLNQVVSIPKTPLVSDIFTHRNQQKWHVKVLFTGWNKPQKNWKKWYDRLLIDHATTWIKAGILDGIQASLHEIPCNRDLVLAVSEFWCPKTSTFIFPWGEATVTLEDVMILGGFPVIGAPFDEPVEEESMGIVQGLINARLALVTGRKGGEREATHSAWIEHFMEEEEEGEIENKEGELEHVAFLSLWLSRFAFPDFKTSGIIGRNVFSIATHLSKGTPVAIAPVVLANLYHELTILTQNAIDLPLKSEVHVSGLFQIIQLWVCERFPGFGANLAKPLELGDPRVARWHKVDFDVNLSFVRSRLKLGEDFLWRPYACDLENWDHLPFYEETEQMFSTCSCLDDCSLSFARFLHSSELIGIDCKEQYQPHRVAMQFGYDQDIPTEFKASTSSWDKGGLYIPSRAFEPGISKSYCNWWKDSLLYREQTVMDALGQRRYKGIGEVEGNQHDEDANGNEKDEINENNGDSNNSDLDHVPLALRLCSTVSKATKHICSDSHDIDHVPLALRLERHYRCNETHCKPLESYASTGNDKTPPQIAEELASPTSYANSQITGEKSSTGKVKNGGLKAPVSKLERYVSALERANRGTD